MTSHPDRDAGAPALALLGLEPVRAALEYAHMRLMDKSALPAGDGHPVVIFPGLATDKTSVGPLKTFLSRLGYAARDWGRGFNTGPQGDIDTWLQALADHVLDGRPVFPAAMALELMAETAALVRPDLAVAEVRDLRMLSGIVLDGDPGRVRRRGAVVRPQIDRGRCLGVQDHPAVLGDIGESSRLDNAVIKHGPQVLSSNGNSGMESHGSSAPRAG